jgi:hypothetical protein
VAAHPVRIAFLIAGTAFRPRVPFARDRTQVAERT